MEGPSMRMDSLVSTLLQCSRVEHYRRCLSPLQRALSLHTAEEGLHDEALTCPPASFPVSLHATSVPAKSQRLWALSLLHDFVLCPNVILPCPFISEVRFVLQMTALPCGALHDFPRTENFLPPLYSSTILHINAEHYILL